MTPPQVARIKISLGNLSVDYEGEQSFIEDGLIKLVEEISALSPDISSNPGTQISEMRANTGENFVSTNTIAQIISAKTGTDLALAAIAKINLVKHNPTASRSEILEEMKEATTYFKDSYASNLTSYLDTLVRSKKVNLVSRSTYALAASERSRLIEALEGA